MKKTLRNYQAKAIQETINVIKSGIRNVYMKCGTGGGKTFVAKSLIDIARKQKPQLRVLFVVPKNILITQTLEAFGEGGIYNAEFGARDMSQPITIASAQSIYKERHMRHFDIVFFDEVHRAKNQHEQILAKVRVENPRAILIGLTATDYNLNENLKLTKACDFSLKYLTEQGYLAPLVLVRGNDSIDIEKLKPQGDSYRQKEVNEQLEIKLEKQVTDMLARASERNKIIIVCTTIAHAISVAELIGNESHLYHSKMTKDERRSELDAWKLGGKYLVSVIAASEGFDFPPADCLVLFRPTRSPTLYEQACGRIARLHESKQNGLILDYGGVINSLGLPYDINVKKKGKREYKDCKHCEVSNPIDAAVCLNCEETFLTKCIVCKKVKPYADKCCTQERDGFKNLTLTPHKEGSQFVPLDRITLHRHTSRKGNDCLKVIWWKTPFSVACTEYYSFKNKSFEMFSRAIFSKVPMRPLDLLEEKIEKIPKHIIVKKVDGYNKVTSLKFY